MTQLAVTLPIDRVSPVRIPVRDLVLGGTDSLTLCVTVVECDNPDAPPIELTGGIGGPAVSLFVWPGGYGPGYGWGGCHDYGWGWHGGGVAGPGTALWSATGDDLRDMSPESSTSASRRAQWAPGRYDAAGRCCWISTAAAGLNCSRRATCTCARWCRVSSRH